MRPADQTRASQRDERQRERDGAARINEIAERHAPGRHAAAHSGDEAARRAADIGAEHERQRQRTGDGGAGRQRHDQQHDRQARMHEPGHKRGDQNGEQRLAAERREARWQAALLAWPARRRPRMLSAEQHQAEPDRRCRPPPCRIGCRRRLKSADADGDQQRPQPLMSKEKTCATIVVPTSAPSMTASATGSAIEAASGERGEEQRRRGRALQHAGDADAGDEGA